MALSSTSKEEPVLFGRTCRHEAIVVFPAAAEWHGPFAVGWIGQDDPLIAPNGFLFVDGILARLDGAIQFFGGFIGRSAAGSWRRRRLPVAEVAAKSIIKVPQVIADIEQNHMFALGLLPSRRLIAGYCP